MDFVASLFLSLPELTQLIVVAIGAATLLLLLRWTAFSVAYGPTVLTMMGIFGCFLGIALGLQHFDPSKIQESMPTLLNGIKTSFWTSIAGVFGALLIKGRLWAFGAPRYAEGQQQGGATVDDLAILLRSLQQSIAGAEDSTLLSQTKLMRQESRDGALALKTSFDQFLAKVAENNSRALIDALREVIKDFNAKINEQFGDNFKRLNEAVGKILEWQAQYRLQMAEMIDQARVSALSMKEATGRYEQLVNRAEIFVKISEQLHSLLQSLEYQRNHLHVSLEDLSRLVSTAASGIPKFEEKIIELTREIDAGVRRNNEQWTEAGRTVTNSMQAAAGELKRTLADNIATAQSEMSGHVTRMSDRIADMTRQFDDGVRKNNEQWAEAGRAVSREMQSATSELKKLLAEAIQTANQDMNTHVRQVSEEMKKQIEVLDKTLETELTNSITTLGRQLRALSQKFVEDYEPLVDKLRTLTRHTREATDA